MLYIKNIQEIFEAAQKGKIFADQKIMADAVPKRDIEGINEDFRQKSSSSGFDLKHFILQNFHFNDEKSAPVREENTAISQHIMKLWDELTVYRPDDEGTLIGLPKPYIVPGGRFNEFFYWDSYFIMLGLQTEGRTEQMHHILENCAYLIDEFGYIPNGNRTYFLGRSQPPYFSLMLKLYADHTGTEIPQKFISALEKEYAFWMERQENLTPQNAYRHTVRLKNGYLLNRYWDDDDEPRSESFSQDTENAENSQSPQYFRNIRAACESGWDFSSRWFEDREKITTAKTLAILPIDLNCLLWHAEDLLADFYTEKNTAKATHFRQKAGQRKGAINEIFWDEEQQTFGDVFWETCTPTKAATIACVYPLFFKLCSEERAQKISENVQQNFLKEGGILTTLNFSGQQWDAPNGWAPLQWTAYIAMKNYDHGAVAKEIKDSWCRNVEAVYSHTQRLMEKYNVIDISSKAGGGEYPNQDGFGWTNGVYLQFKKRS